MPFLNDAGFAAEVGTTFGEYLTTYTSQTGQVRTDLFRSEDHLEAHITFPTGLNSDEVTDRYVTELWDFACQHGYEDRIRLILS